jgi:hypothetical protein
MLGAFVISVIGLSAVCEAQVAEGERIVEIWTCTLNEGYSMEDIEIMSTRWLDLVLSGGATDVDSYRLSHLVGTMRGHEPAEDVTSSFLFIDSFPDVASWMAAKRAQMTPEGQEIMAAYTQLNTCGTNTLYRRSSRP